MAPTFTWFRGHGDPDDPIAGVPVADGTDDVEEGTLGTPADGDWASLDLRAAASYLANPARDAQEAAWADARIDERQIWGVREAQRIYGDQLRQAVRDLLVVRTLVSGMAQPQSALGSLLPPLLALIADFQDSKGDLVTFVAGWGRRPAERAAALRSGEEGKPTLEVCVRKRPMLQFEASNGAIDTVEMLPRSDALLCHDGRLSRTASGESRCRRRPSTATWCGRGCSWCWLAVVPLSSAWARPARARRTP